MKIEFPTAIDPYFVPFDKATRNQSASDEVTQLDLIYSIVELEKKVGILGPFDHYADMPAPEGADTWIQDSHEYRLTAAETDIDIIQASFHPAGLDTEIQFNDLGIFGSSALLTFDKTAGVLRLYGSIVIGTSPAAAGLVRLPNNNSIRWRDAADTADKQLLLDSSNRIFMDTHLLVQGPDGFNATNETARLYLGDTTKYLEAKYGFGLTLAVNAGPAISIDENMRWCGFLSVTAPARAVDVGETIVLQASQSDDYSSGLGLAPTYDDESNGFTVTRHNYITLKNVALVNTAAVTDGCVFRFDAAAGTHKAIDSGTTHPHPATTDAWIKVNINGTVHYIPAFTHKT